MVGSLDDFDPPLTPIGEQRVQALALIGAVRPDQAEPREQSAQTCENQKGAIAILDIRGMNNRVQRETLGVDDDVTFASLDILARVLPHRIDRGPPFSADLTDWLSIIPALGLDSRPMRSRSFMNNA
jgi:hypothetical protein